ncbi:MAG: hypothetical protein NT007_02005 [Candidatus Kapabacteria bacterium]|nr:hypothetical protein [Candidatus Kapabacteria bacterium]
MCTIIYGFLPNETSILLPGTTGTALLCRQQDVCSGLSPFLHSTMGTGLGIQHSWELHGYYELSISKMFNNSNPI